MNKVVRNSVVISGALATLLALSACSGATGDPTQAGKSAGATKSGALTVGVTIHQADDYFQTIANAIDAKVKADGGSSVLVNTQANAATEASGFQNLISRQVDGIVTSPLSPTGSLASIKAAAAAKIPIICYNTCLSDADNKKYVKAFIQSDQTALGTATGTYAAKDLLSRGIKTATLGMLNCNQYEACKQRQDGFVNALKAGGVTVKVVANQSALAPDEANSKATDILTAHPDINVFWCSSQGSTEGMVSALKATGRKNISEYGTDVSATLIKAIQSGDLLATTGQDSKKTGELAVEDIQKAVAGKEVTPFLVSLPGNLYSSADKAGLQDYLDTHK